MTGTGEKRNGKGLFGYTFGRGVFALLLSAALVVSDALPMGPPMGLPDAVKAADKPEMGTISFVKYTKQKDIADVAKADETYEDCFIAYEYKEVYYAPYTRILGVDNWPVMKIETIMPQFDADSDSFLSRTKIKHRKFNYDHGRTMEEEPYQPFYTISITSEYNGIGEEGDESKAVVGGEYVNNTIFPHDTGRYYEVEAVAGSWRGARFMLSYHSNKDRDFYVQLKGDDTKIQGTRLNGSPFLFYKLSTVTYTCINSDYKIGENQVYVADSDLFLKEGVKLTVPEGAVLCVKNGPFYVNGEIECSGTILVEDGGVIMPYESTGAGSRIVLKEGGAMIIRSGGRVYAGCPKGSLGTMGDQGWLDMYAGLYVINFGLLVAGQCNFKYGQATLENHKGGAMFLGYTVSNEGKSKFMNARWSGSGSSGSGNVESKPDDKTFGLVKTNGAVHYGQGANTTVLKTWDGATTMFANKKSDGGQTAKLYSYDKDGKCTIKSAYEP